MKSRKFVALILSILLTLSAIGGFSVFGNDSGGIGFSAQPQPDGSLVVTVQNISTNAQGNWRLAIVGGVANWQINGVPANFTGHNRDYYAMHRSLEPGESYTLIITTCGEYPGWHYGVMTLWTTQGPQMYPFNGTILGSVDVSAETQEPEDPIDPTDPKDPCDPYDPECPKDPVDPKDPTDPQDPVDPTDPQNPTEPPSGNNNGNEGNNNGDGENGGDDGYFYEPHEPYEPYEPYEPQPPNQTTPNLNQPQQPDEQPIEPTEPEQVIAELPEEPAPPQEAPQNIIQLPPSESVGTDIILTQPVDTTEPIEAVFEEPEEEPTAELQEEPTPPQQSDLRPLTPQTTATTQNPQTQDDSPNLWVLAILGISTAISGFLTIKLKSRR